MPYSDPLPPYPLPRQLSAFLYGDQFAVQAEERLIEIHRTARHGRLIVKASDGSVPKDWLNEIRSDLRGGPDRAYRTPYAIALSFSDLGDYDYVVSNDNYDLAARDAWFAANPTATFESSGKGYLTWSTVPDGVVGYSIEEDGMILGSLSFYLTFIRLARAAAAAETPVYWIVTPPPVVDTNRLLEIEIIREICASYEWHMVYANQAVADTDGSYIDELPCLGDELPADGCSGGSIAIRLGEDFALTGIDNYSSGARRWASAAVQGMPMATAEASGPCTVWACP